jgi:hypothetical protein
LIVGVGVESSATYNWTLKTGRASGEVGNLAETNFFHHNLNRLENIDGSLARSWSDSYIITHHRRIKMSPAVKLGTT